MEICALKTKTKDLLYDFAYYTQDGNFYSSTCEIKAIFIVVSTVLSKDTHTKVLEARIQWCYSRDTNKTATFENSVQGFDTACEWLDKKRLEFIDELL